MTMEQFRLYEINWIATFESAGRSREEAVLWMKSRPNDLKPRVRVPYWKGISHD